MNVYEMLDAQSKTIKKLQAEHQNTLLEANHLMLKYQAAITFAQEAIAMLRATGEKQKEQIKKLECEALGKAWNATETKGEGQGQ